jgi:hypothetical protein
LSTSAQTFATRTTGRTSVRASTSLLVTALKIAIEDVARAKHLKGYRVLDKVNARGKTVIALILPREQPAGLREENKKTPQ